MEDDFFSSGGGGILKLGIGEGGRLRKGVCWVNDPHKAPFCVLQS